MKYPECFKECDSIYLDLRDPKEKFEVKSAQISGVWASALMTMSNLSKDELLQISRSFRRSEFSNRSVKITFVNPYCLCIIYPNGKVSVMGSVTEKQAYKTVAKLVKKIKYKTKWKVVIPSSCETTNSFSFDNVNKSVSNKNKDRDSKIKLDGNGLLWKYMDNETIFRVSECLKTFRIDQLYCRIVLNKELNLYEIFDKIAKKKINVNIFSGYLRVQLNLNRPLGNVYQNMPNSLNSNYYNNDHTNNSREREYHERERDIENELERALENEIMEKTRSCLLFRRGVIILLGSVNRQEVSDSFNQLMTLI